jgi:hypothetical protein
MDDPLFDCDFNQMLGLTAKQGAPAHIGDFDHTCLATRLIDVGDHYSGCTAGWGST